MFKGEKTSLFWVGLLLLSVSSVALFSIIWSVISFNSSFPTGNLLNTFRNDIPVIVGAIVFMLVGLYMMKSGIKKHSTGQQTLRAA